MHPDDSSKPDAESLPPHSPRSPHHLHDSPVASRRPAPSSDAPLAVVTGASSGIGLAIATLLAQRGYRTVLVSRRGELLDKIAAGLSRSAPSAGFVLDLANTAEIAPAMARLVGEHGVPNVVVNNAGSGIYAPFLEHSPEEFDGLMRLNFGAAVEVTRALLPGMTGRAAGAVGDRSTAESHIFNICSMSARVGPWGHAAYAASKGAMRSFTEVMHAEHARKGVRFTAIYPGVVRTPYFQKGSMKALWPKVEHHAVSADLIARSVINTLGRDRVAVFSPRKCRALDWIWAASPMLAQRMVRWGSGSA